MSMPVYDGCLWKDHLGNSSEGDFFLLSLILAKLFGCDLVLLLVSLSFGGCNLLFRGGCGPSLNEDPDVTAEAAENGNATKLSQR